MEMTSAVSTGLRAWLKQKTDLAQYRPQAAPDAMASQLTGREGPYVILKNPRTKTYYRLTDRDFFLWQRMDGTRTVKDLVVAYFVEYKSFAFARVASLVVGLKASLLLTDRPVGVYGQVHARLARRKPLNRLSGLASAFMGQQFAISGLDRFMAATYRYGGRLLYTWPALILYVLLTVPGLYCFYRAFRGGSYGVVTIGGSYLWGIIGLLVANLLSVFVHEMGHALTVKHYGREVRRGGFLVYFGTPGFFVDTTDIWMEGKRARLAVTWAGPFSGLILGGLASIILVVWPGFRLNPLLFQFAFMTYLSVFFNLNPLLELDGYYLLMDAIEIPALRRRSLEFLRTGLTAKVKGIAKAGKSVKAALASFSREEVIFTVFGVLSAAWTAYAIYTVAKVYQRQLVGAVRDLWTGGGGVGRILLTTIGAVLSLVVVVGLGMWLFGLVRGVLRSAARHGLFKGWNLAAVLLVLGVLLTVAPGYFGHPEWLPFVGLAALFAAAALAVWNALDLAGSHLAAAFWLLAAFALVLLLREATVLGQGWLGSELANPLGAGLGLLAMLALLLAGLALFAETDLKQLPSWEKALLAAGLVASYGLAVWAPTLQPTPLRLPDPALLWAISSAVAPLMAVLLTVPMLVSFLRTGLAPAWTLLALALAYFVVVALVPQAQVALLPALVLAATMWTFHLAYAGLTVAKAQPQATLDLTDPQRLAQAFASALRSLYEESRGIGGDYQTRVLLEQFNNYALAAGWRLQMVGGLAEDRLPADLTLDQKGEAYGTALSLLLDLMARQVGEKLTVRGLQRAYDGLPWDQREVAAQYLFPHVRRAESLSREFHSTHQAYHTLLRRMPLFATMDESELDLLCSSLKLERLGPGRTVIRQGDRGDKFYIIQRGRVEVLQRDERGVTDVVDQRDRGDYFGELALLNDAPRNATCRTTMPTELLSLSRADFERLVKARFEIRDTVDRSIAQTELLRRVPLFADLDAHQIRLIAAQMREESYEPGDEIIRQGEVGGTFYVIESGRVETSVRQDGGERVVAQRGPGEYVGEIALLMQVPRTATVRALTQVRVLALDRDEFDRLVASHLYVSRSLEREASRRMLGLRTGAPSPMVEKAG